MLLNGEDIDDYLGDTMRQDGFDIKVTEEMFDAVRRGHTAILKTLNQVGYDPIIRAEMTLDMDGTLDGHGEPIFGTTDAIIIQPFVSLDVFDYKHGQGVAVNAEKNEQMIEYAFGALEKYGWDFEVVRLHILQPRAQHPDGWHRVWETTPDEIHTWVGVFQEAIDDSVSDTPTFNPGEKQCMWCPKGGNCTKRYQMVQETAGSVFDPEDERHPNELDESDLSTILDMKSQVLDFFKQAGGEALGRAEKGTEIPGWKLVRAKTNRRYICKKEAVVALKELAKKKRGLKVSDVVVQSPISFTNAIKLLGMDNVSFLIEKPQGSLVLAPQDDKRDAESVFTDIESKRVPTVDTET
jgi:hypothetical protein